MLSRRNALHRAIRTTIIKHQLIRPLLASCLYEFALGYVLPARLPISELLGEPTAVRLSASTVLHTAAAFALTFLICSTHLYRFHLKNFDASEENVLQLEEQLKEKDKKASQS